MCLSRKGDGDLLVDELNDIWNAAPKFPDVGGDDTRIDVDSFVQIYRDVDDLFEYDDEEKSSDVRSEKPIEESQEDVDSLDDEDETVEAELENVFETLCDKYRLVSKYTLKEWEEIEKLLDLSLIHI